ncbi:MAG: hypothetical protein MZU97_13470 [Bacillus subtilis]|nr:hypothetical protein [Bacillus subtilis]
MTSCFPSTSMTEVRRRAPNMVPCVMPMTSGGDDRVFGVSPTVSDCAALTAALTSAAVTGSLQFGRRGRRSSR